jgi:hypothetical protein
VDGFEHNDYDYYDDMLICMLLYIGQKKGSGRVNIICQDALRRKLSIIASTFDELIEIDDPLPRQLTSRTELSAIVPRTRFDSIVGKSKPEIETEAPVEAFHLSENATLTWSCTIHR